MPLNISAFECSVLQSLSVVPFFYYCCNVLLISIRHNCFVNNNCYDVLYHNFDVLPKQFSVVVI